MLSVRISCTAKQLPKLPTTWTTGSAARLCVSKPSCRPSRRKREFQPARQTHPARKRHPRPLWRRAQALSSARQPQPPPELKASPNRRDLDLQGDAKRLFTEVARAYGLEAVFDSDYQPGAAWRFRLDNADYREALRALEAATASFVVPVGERRLLVVKDTVQKRTESEPVVSVAVPLPEPVSLQDAQELMRGVQQVMGLQRMQLDSQRRIILVRDRVSRVRPAQALIEQLLASPGFGLHRSGVCGEQSRVVDQLRRISPDPFFVGELRNALELFTFHPRRAHTVSGFRRRQDFFGARSHGRAVIRPHEQLDGPHSVPDGDSLGGWAASQRSRGRAVPCRNRPASIVPDRRPACPAAGGHFRGPGAGHQGHAARERRRRSDAGPGSRIQSSHGGGVQRYPRHRRHASCRRKCGCARGSGRSSLA